MKVEKDYLKKRSEQHIHSPAHALADELSEKFSDRKHFAMYLGLANRFDHSVLRRIAGEVLESKSAKNPAALFAYLVKKNNTPKPDEKDSHNS